MTTKRLLSIKFSNAFSVLRSSRRTITICNKLSSTSTQQAQAQSPTQTEAVTQPKTATATSSRFQPSPELIGAMDALSAAIRSGNLSQARHMNEQIRQKLFIDSNPDHIRVGFLWLGRKGLPDDPEELKRMVRETHNVLRKRTNQLSLGMGLFWFFVACFCVNLAVDKFVEFYKDRQL